MPIQDIIDLQEEFAALRKENGELFHKIFQLSKDKQELAETVEKLYQRVLVLEEVVKNEIS